MKYIKNIILALSLIPAIAQAAAAPAKKGINWNIVILNCQPQVGSTCGYHAVKNSIIILDWLNGRYGKISQVELETKLKSRNPIYCDIQAMKNLVRPGQKDTENIDGAEVLQILQKYGPKLDGQYSVIPNIIEAEKDNTTLVPEAMHLIKTVRKQKNASYALVLGSMEAKGGKKFGHWISVVVDRTGDNYNLYVTDSLESSDTMKMVAPLQRLITSLRSDVVSAVKYEDLLAEVYNKFERGAEINENRIFEFLETIEQVVDSGSFKVKSFYDKNIRAVKYILNSASIYPGLLANKANDLLGAIEAQQLA